jgi:hypothetical protein
MKKNICITKSLWLNDSDKANSVSGTDLLLGVVTGAEPRCESGGGFC